MGWLDAASGYQVCLGEDGRVRCRNAKGRLLASVPAALKNDPEVVRLRQLAEWLDRHARECLSTVDNWMVRSLPVPVALISEVWADQAWADALRDLVVTADGEHGTETGFLRDVHSERGLGVVTLDGETLRLRPEVVRIPHPVLLPDLAELREFAAELGVRQQVDQLFRQVFARPANPPADRRVVHDFAGGRFRELAQATARCRSLGYQVSGGDVVHSAFEDGRVVRARFWIGSDHPEIETETGGLSWTLEDGTPLSLNEVGPVAWSEGMRMASAVFAGRVVETAVAA